MVFEHFALNVKDAKAVAAWYVKHCGMQIVRAFEEPPFARFVADSTGRMVMEIYANPADAIPDYNGQHPLRFHVAFAVDDAGVAKENLTQAGASFVEELNPDAGSRLIMMRDPWGIPLQICQRSKPMI